MFIDIKRTIIGYLFILNLISCTHQFKIKVNDIIRLVNNIPKHSWKAGFNFDPSWLDNVSYLMGVQSRNKLDPSDILLTNEPYFTINRESIPASYDVTRNWSACKSVITIRDQSNCGSCWALSTASAFGDRLCIASNTSINEVLSGEYINSCCKGRCGDGCNGGHPEKAWKFIKKQGLCTGGNYGSNEGCQPYSIKPCPRNKYYIESKDYTPQCYKDRCTNSNYTSFNTKLYYAKKVYSVKPKTEAIMYDIYINGPVVAAMKVYDDFLYYKDGIYQYTIGSSQGDHAIKILGWGQEDGIDYWLCANTWGESWGMNGMFKIRRGRNECGIESRITGGLPNV